MTRPSSSTWLQLSGAGLLALLVACAGTADLVPDARKIQLVDARQLGDELIGSVRAVHGSGCGLFGARGDFEGAVALLKNEAAKLEADYLVITSKREPYSDGDCLHNEFILEAQVFRAISPTTPQQVPKTSVPAALAAGPAPAPAAAPAAAPSNAPAVAVAAPADPTAGLGPAGNGPPSHCPAVEPSARAAELAIESGDHECRIREASYTGGDETGGEETVFRVVAGESNGAGSAQDNEIRYDANGNLVRFARGVRIDSFGYEGSRMVSHEATTGQGSIKSVYEYDDRGYLLRVATRGLSGAVSTILVQYADNCRPSAIRGYSGTYGFDYAKGREPRLKTFASTVQRGYGGAQQSAYAVEYDRNGRISQMTGNWGVDTYSYAKSGLLTGYKRAEIYCNATYQKGGGLLASFCGDGPGSSEARYEGRCPFDLCDAPPGGGSSSPRVCVAFGHDLELRTWPEQVY